MSASADKINQLFWLNYAQAIKDKATANFGPSGAFFVASEAQKGPIAGDNIPDEYTYQGLYDIGNNLLADDNLFYNPSALHGYAKALKNFLDWVDLEGKPSTNDDNALLNALKDQQAFQIKEATESDRAFEKFAKEEKMGLTGGQTFYTWIANGKAPAYVAAKTQSAQVASVIQSIQARINGPKAAQINDDRAALAKAFDQQADFVGYNMHGAVGNVPTPAELLRQFNSGDKPQPPSFQRIPAYDAPAYKAFVQDAQRKASGGNYDPTDSITFTIDETTDTSSFKFGQTQVGANVGVSTGWFSFNVGGSHSESSSTLETGGESSSVSVKILFDKIQKIDIKPGSWNVEISSYKLRSDAPKSVKSLVRPSQLVVATRLGYEISISSSLASTIDKKFQESTSAGGSVSIFGIPVSIGGSGSHSSETSSHEAHLDVANKTLKVVPKDDSGAATVIGIVGEKFNILVS